MISEALHYFYQLSKQASGFHSISTPNGDTIVALPDGTTKTIEQPLLAITDELATLSSMIDWIKLRDLGVEVFVSENCIDAVCGRYEKSIPERARLKLDRSQAYLILGAFFKPNCLIAQRDLIRALRGPLAGMYNPALLAMFRSVEFRSSASKNSEINRGGDTLGRSINREARIGGEDDIPESIAFTLPMYAIQDAPSVTIEAAIEVNFEAEKFELLPIGESVTRASEVSLLEIASSIREETLADLYFGAYR
jgi:hypothetical protein